LFHLGNSTIKGNIIGHNYRQGVIIRWVVKCITKGNEAGYEKDGYFSIATNQTPNATWFYPLQSDNNIGQYHFKVMKDQTGQAPWYQKDCGGNLPLGSGR